MGSNWNIFWNLGLQIIEICHFNNMYHYFMTPTSYNFSKLNRKQNLKKVIKLIAIYNSTNNKITVNKIWLEWWGKIIGYLFYYFLSCNELTKLNYRIGKP